MAYRITLPQLMRAVPNANRTRATELVETLNLWGDRFGINTPARVTHFLSQCFCESGALAQVEENLNYSASRLVQVFPKYFNATTAPQYAHKPEKIANRVYANRLGNGSEASGDGWKYRGRGIIQCTGKATYQAYQNSGFCVGNLLAHPEWLAQKPGAYKSAMWFWWKNSLSTLADKDLGDGKLGEDIVKQITKKVNGGYNGLSTRLYYYRRFKKELGL